MNDNNKKLIIAIPCAGGNAENYNHLGKYLHTKIDALDYPGHWKRYGEPCANDIYELAEDLIKKVLELISKYAGYEIYLLGHSMGCILVYMISDIWEIKMLDIPIFAIIGIEDVLISGSKMKHWGKYSLNLFCYKDIKGDHFFIINKSKAKEICLYIDEFINYLDENSNPQSMLGRMK